MTSTFDVLTFVRQVDERHVCRRPGRVHRGPRLRVAAPLQGRPIEKDNSIHEFVNVTSKERVVVNFIARKVLIHFFSASSFNTPESGPHA